jgi:hypothetical protein
MIRLFLILFTMFVLACGEGSMTSPQEPIHTYTAGSATLSWDANAASDNITEYRLYRSTVPGEHILGEPFIVVDGTTTTYTDTTGLVGVEYFFVLTAFNGLESEFSNEVSKLY